MSESLSRVELEGKPHTCMFHWHQGAELGYQVLENIGFHGRNKFSSLWFSRAASALEAARGFPREVIRRDCGTETCPSWARFNLLKRARLGRWQLGHC